MDRSAILAEVRELAGILPPRDPDEIMIREFADSAGLGWSAGKKHLERLVQGGVMTKRQATVNGRPAWVYRKAGV